MQPQPAILVFCDLDDTLFDPDVFAVGASARGPLNRIARQQVPLVFTSSKTRAELELIQQELGIHQPFICENGAAVFVPRGYFGFRVPEASDIAGYEAVEFGRPYAEVVAALHRTAVRLGIEIIGFSDMSVEDVAADCGLTLLQARLAKLREYDEPFRVLDTEPGTLPRLAKALRTAGLDCTSRGRYHHVGVNLRDIGGKCLHGLYRRSFGEVLTVAFGDHSSAAPLLRHVDLPLVVRSNVAGETMHLLTAVPTARLSAADCISTWAEKILDIAGGAQRSNRLCSP